MCWTMSQVYNQPLLTFMSFLLFSPVDLSPPGQTFYHTFLKFCSFCCWDHNSSKTKSLSGGVLLLIKSSPVPHRDAVKMESSVQGEKEEFQCLTAGGDVKCQSEESQSLFLTEIEHFSTLFFVFLVPVNVLWLLLVPVLKNVDTINIYRPILEFSFVHSPIRSTDTDVWFHWLYALNWKEVLYTGGDTALWDMKRTWQWGHQAGKCHIFWFNKIAILFLAMFLIPILWDLVFYPNQHMSNNDKITQIQYVLFITH